MLGGNWDHDRTFGGKLPTAATLDKYVTDRPVFIRRYDGHMALANTAALKLAGITADTKDPAGGVIYRLADGKTPTGMLNDNAMGLVEPARPGAGRRRRSPRRSGRAMRALCRGRRHQRAGHGRQLARHPADAVPRPPAAGPRRAS